MGEDAPLAAVWALLLRFRWAARSPQHWWVFGLGPRAAQRSWACCSMSSAVRSAVATAASEVHVECPHRASALRRLGRQYEGRLRRCARAACGPPKTHGGCISRYWSSVGSCRWAERLCFGPRMADERRDWTFRLFDTLYVRAHGCLACAQLCLMVYAVCPVHHVPRTRLEGPCEGLCPTQCSVSSGWSQGVMGRWAVALVRSHRHR